MQSRTNQNNVLIVDDDLLALELMYSIFRHTRFEAIKASNGKEAMQIITKHKFNIIITDLDMPEVNGKDLIRYIKEEDPDASIIVETMHHEIDVVIDIMKMGVFDYIVKPIQPKELLLKVERAEESSILKRNKRLYEKERLLRIESQLEWYQWQKKHLSGTEQGKNSFYKLVFENLKRNLSQGAGFGAMLTIIDLILNAPRDEKGNYLIDPDIVGILKDNNLYAKKVLDIFAELDRISSDKSPLEKYEYQTVYQFLKDSITDLQRMAKIKNHTIICSEMSLINSKRLALLKEEYIKKVFHELLINAFKFSVKNTQITILFYLTDSSFEFTFMNQPEKYNRIPEECSNLIFEPFFRLNNYVNEEYESLDYGLGLTIVEKIIAQFRGKISVSNVVDHTETFPITKTTFTVSIPIYKENNAL